MTGYDLFAKYNKEEERIAAFEYFLRKCKQNIKRREKAITSFFVRNIDLSFVTLETHPALLTNLLLSENREIDHAFSQNFGQFLLKFRSAPLIYCKILQHWITRYPAIVIRNIRETTFDMFIDSLDVEISANTFVKFYELRSEEFEIFVGLLKQSRFFSRLLLKLEEVSNVSLKEESSSEYDYEKIGLSFSNKSRNKSNKKSYKETLKLEKIQKDEEQRDSLKKEKFEQINIETAGVVKEFRKLKINDSEREEDDVDDGDKIDARANCNVKDVEVNNVDTKYSIDSIIQIRRNILTIILSFIVKYSDDTINHKIMKQASVILNLFLQESVHITELNPLYNILKTLVSKRNGRALVDLIGKRMNTFKLLFNTLDDVCVPKKGRNGYSKKKTSVVDLRSGLINKEPKDESQNNEKFINYSPPKNVVYIDRIFENPNFASFLEIEYIGSANEEKRKSFIESVEKQLIKLKAAFFDLHFILKLKLMCVCSKYKRIREIMRKQCLHTFFVDVFFRTPNTFVMHSFTLFFESCLKDYKFMIEILGSTNLLKTAQRTAREELLTTYEKYPLRKPIYIFNTFIVSLIINLKKELSVVSRVDLKAIENRNSSNPLNDNKGKLNDDHNNLIFRRIIGDDVEHGSSKDNSGKNNNNTEKERKQVRDAVSPRRSRNALNVISTRTDIINSLLLKLRYLESDEWLFVQDSILEVNIARYKVTYDDRSVNEYLNNCTPENMYRFLFKNMVWDMPFCDIFSENGI